MSNINTKIVLLCIPLDTKSWVNFEFKVSNFRLLQATLGYYSLLQNIAGNYRLLQVPAGPMDMGYINFVS